MSNWWGLKISGVKVSGKLEKCNYFTECCVIKKCGTIGGGGGSNTISMRFVPVLDLFR